MRTPWWYAFVRDWRLRMMLETLNWPSRATLVVPADPPEPASAEQPRAPLAGQNV